MEAVDWIQSGLGREFICKNVKQLLACLELSAEEHFELVIVKCMFFYEVKLS